VHHRVFELKDEIALSISDSDSDDDDANLRNNKDFIQKLAYFVDTFEKLT
jgi:hypothetical protein